jgi:DNA-directed RNA polymerase III subunit RPC4
MDDDAEVMALDGSEDAEVVLSSDDGDSDSGGNMRRVNVDAIDAAYVDEDVKPLLPVRVKRYPHQDRAPQITSSLGADQNTTHEAEDQLKSIGSHDAEMVRKYRGVYQDDHDQPSASKAAAPATRKALDPKHKRKAEAEAPVLWTDDDKNEWERRKTADQALVDELSQEKASAQEMDVDEAEDRLRDRVYILTFPPVLPALLDPTKPKPEPDAPLPARPDAATTAGAENDPVVIKEDPAAAPREELTRKGGFPLRPAHLPALEPGRVGRLVVRRSGRATLDWGGTSLRVGLGLTPDVLQDVVSVSGVGDGDGVAAGEEGFAGRACSFGQVRGKFVVTPDWDELLGSSDG